jgi:hypothetical protein
MGQIFSTHFMTEKFYECENIAEIIINSIGRFSKISS